MTGTALLMPRSSPFAGMKRHGYQVILADPPWLFNDWSEKGARKNPKRHYRCMPTPEIEAFPVAELAAPGAWCVMWATAPMLDDAMRVLKSWGFRYVTCGFWAKQSKTGRKWHFGTGRILRGTIEAVLIGKVGDPRLSGAPGSRSIRNLIGDQNLFEMLGATSWMIASPVREHSRKPDELISSIEKIFNGPYCELFARSTRPGWDSWGDQVNKFDGIAGLADICEAS